MMLLLNLFSLNSDLNILPHVIECYFIIIQIRVFYKKITAAMTLFHSKGGNFIALINTLMVFLQLDL